MVSYCCVKGCNNNSSTKKKDPKDNTSFHAFPANQDLKTKWLRAIGRPNWDPPNHARICSAHFSYEQINHDSRRTRIRDDAYPVNALPLNSNFEASDIEVCRICLATDLKMYSLKDGVLKAYIESFGGFNDNYNIEGLPQFVCYECSAHLIKCYNLVEKSMIAQATLLDIFARNGQITKSLISKQNRKELNLTSTLTCHKIVPTHLFEFKYVDEQDVSHLIRSNFNDDTGEKKKLEDNDNNCKIEGDFKASNIFSEMEISNEINFKLETTINDNECKSEELTVTKDNKNFEEIQEVKKDNDSDVNSIHDLKMGSPGYSSDDENGISDVFEMVDIKKADEKNRKEEVTQIECTEESKVDSKKSRKRLKRKNLDGFTPDEINMQKYFNIVKLSFQEQIEEWKKGKEKRQWKSETVYECEICSKVFAHVNTYRTHLSNHDPSRGKVECPVCKLRFKNDVLVRSHANRAHGKKFYCKACPKVFNNIGVSKKHRMWHAGHVYKCGSCAFSSAHESALGAHARRRHAAALACARCGRACRSRRGLALHHASAHTHAPLHEPHENNAYRCEQCDISFVSEGARRVHILTSSQHRRKNDLCDATPRDPNLKNTCSKCGTEFPTTNDLIQHVKTEHPRSGRKKTSWRLPDDSYPTQCEHCNEIVNNRKEHWWHVRRQHPKEKDSYRPVITAVCETCGKGFQNSTKLHLHELRHRAPSVRCASCPRVFYDKYALARHAAVHTTERPHRCGLCGRAFKLRGNLERHSRVHTGVTPYECTICGKKFKYSTSMNLHVRTVHYKLPHPPRKKRTCRPLRNNANDHNVNNDM